ncbi:MAG: site-2 protease family protein [Marinifilaceae bacterium]
MIIDAFCIILIVAFLMLVHELGHFIAAKLFGLKIYKIGVTMRPIPHIYIAIRWPQKKWQELFYLFAGSLVTIVLFGIMYAFDFFNSSVLYAALSIQLVLETNPFYSDYVFAMVNAKQEANSININTYSFYEKLKDYRYSFKWNVHFILWSLVICFLLKNTI